ncbi:MAG: hypothetical protein Q8O41_07180 [Candidatus Methanoperedens sp.]|nr:hypothetical protein [Candidatus Methanoperedens sp.]
MNSSAKREIIQILSGKHENLNPPDYVMLLTDVIFDPKLLPYRLEEVRKLKPSEELRNALLRVQIDSDLRFDEDLQKYRIRHYVAQVIERLIFGNNLLLEGKRRVEGDEQAICASSCASCR